MVALVKEAANEGRRDGSVCWAGLEGGDVGSGWETHEGNMDECWATIMNGTCMARAGRVSAGTWRLRATCGRRGSSFLRNAGMVSVIANNGELMQADLDIETKAGEGREGLTRHAGVGQSAGPPRRRQLSPGAWSHDGGQGKRRGNGRLASRSTAAKETQA